MRAMRERRSASESSRGETASEILTQHTGASPARTGWSAFAKCSPDAPDRGQAFTAVEWDAAALSWAELCQP